MRQPRTLFRYLVREIVIYGLIAFSAIMLVLISHNLFRRLDDLMMTGFTSRDVWALLVSLIPMLTAYTVPLAFLLGSAEVIGDNSAQTLLPSVVAKQDLETAMVEGFLEIFHGWVH